MITISETLSAKTVYDAGFAPYLLYSEVLEGARRPLSFLEVVTEDFSLIGKDGYMIKFLKLTQLEATQDQEADILGATGMPASDKTPTKVDLEIPDAIFSAVQISDFLLEDQPSVDWVRIHLRNMGSAVMEFLDELVYKELRDASGTIGVSCASLTFGVVCDSVAEMENENFLTGDGTEPFLILSPAEASYLMQDTSFVESRRYTTRDLSRIVEGEIGMYAGCRVLKTSYLKDKSYVFIVYPPTGALAPVVVLGWKRRLTVKSEYEAVHSYTYYVTSIRANAKVVQSKGVIKISVSPTP